MQSYGTHINRELSNILLRDIKITYRPHCRCVIPLSKLIAKVKSNFAIAING